MSIPASLQPIQWTPLRNYSGYEHVLGAGAQFIHPLNGNQYFWACEKQGGIKQNLAIYRERGTTQEFEHVVTFEGGIDSESQITPGAMFIGQGGALIVATSLVPKGVPHVTQTGFQGVRCRIPNIDAPWSFNDVYARIEALEAQVAALIAGGSSGLSPRYVEALERTCDYLNIP